MFDIGTIFCGCHLGFDQIENLVHRHTPCIMFILHDYLIFIVYK